MIRKATPAIILSVLLTACGSRAGGGCAYTVQDDATGNRTAALTMPIDGYPGGHGNGSVTLTYPREPDRRETLYVPACKRDDADATIKRRLLQDRIQAEAGVPWSARHYE